MTTPTAQAASDELAGLYVFHARRLRDGVELPGTARFEDDSWPLGPVTLQRHERGLILHFGTVPERYRLAVKHLCYLALSGPLPPGEPRPKIATVQAVFHEARLFHRWLDQQQTATGTAIDSISQVTTVDIERYLRHMLMTIPSQQYRQHHRGKILYFWRYRQFLGANALPFDPRTIDGWFEKRRQRSADNATDRIPEQVHSRLLVWALRFVDEFSADIITAIRQWQQLRGRDSADPRSAARRDRYARLGGDVQAYLDAAIRENRPLPGYNGRPNVAAIAASVGCPRNSLVLHQAAIARAAAMVGVSDYAQLCVEITGRLDGRQWIDGVRVEPREGDSLTVLTQVLQAACYILIAFLSGMRDCEVKHLRKGCVSVLRDGTGTPYRWTVAGLAFKGEDDEAGVPATWVIGEPAARAVAVLEQVHEGRTEWLLGAARVGPGAGSAGRSGNPALTLPSTNRQLNRFVRWVNDYCTATGRGDAIPDVDGRPWPVTTRQFRRTLAWFIARRPGGTIAGAIQYRHHGIQMFEGYAGTSDSGFRAEVEAEEALARAEHLLAMIDQNEHTQLRGPAAAEARQRLTELDNYARFAGVTITDRRRLQRLMSRDDPAVYPGRYATCVYDHTKALCHARAGLGGQAATPDLGNCKPLACRNVALTPGNVTAWRDELASVDADLAARPLLPPLLQAQLEQRRDDVRAHLDRYDKEHP
jgi:integrase